MINLIYQGRRTAAYQKLIDGQTAEGACVVQRAKGFSDYGVIAGLLREGWPVSCPMAVGGMPDGGYVFVRVSA